MKTAPTLRADWHGHTVWYLRGDWTPSTLLEALQAAPFRAPLPEALYGCGWAPIFDVTAELNGDNCLAGYTVGVCWRVDTKKVPKTAITTLTAQRVRAEEEETGGRLHKDEIAVIREAVEAELRRTTPATTEAVIVAFDLTASEIVVGTHKPAVLDAISKVLRRDGIHHSRPSLADQVVALHPDAEQGLTGKVSPPEEEGEDVRPRELETGVAHQALTWAWWLYQHGESLPGFQSQLAEWAWALKAGLTLHLSTGEKRAVLHHDEAARDPLARLALLQGDQVGGCKLGLYVNDLEAATLKLEVAEEQLVLAGLDVELKRSQGTTEERLVAEVFDRQSAYTALLDMLGKFGTLRGSDRYGQHLGSVRTWLTMAARQDLDDAIGGPR